jgi:hypothetical protein
MNLRKITSLTAILAFFHLMFTSVVLYIVPPGRVAYWSDWHFLGLKNGMGESTYFGWFSLFAYHVYSYMVELETDC